MMVAVAAVAGTLATVRPAPAVPPASPAVAVTADIPYSTLANGYVLTLDVYRPDGAGPYPAVLVTHGALEVGDKTDYAGEATALAQDGFVAFTPNYRLDCDPTKPPAGIDARLCGWHANDPVVDLEAAMRWIRAHASEYGGDPARVGAFGGSGGGDLVLMLATWAPADGARPDAAAAWSGQPKLADCTLSVSTVHPTTCEKDTLYVGCPLSGTGACPDLWTAASASTYVVAGDPPLYLSNGTGERIPYQEARDMDLAMRAAGNVSYFRQVPAALHSRQYEDFVVGGCCTTVFMETRGWLHTWLDPSPQADLTLAAQPDASAPAPGQRVTVTFTVTDQGPAWGSGATLQYPLPAGVDLAGVTTTQGTCSGTTTVQCTLGLIPNGSTATVAVTWIARAPGTRSSTASVSASGADPNPADDQAPVAVTVTGAAGTVYQTLLDAGFSPVKVSSPQGGVVQWYLGVRNTASREVRDGSGLSLFDSGLAAPGSLFSFAFAGAGTYRVLDPSTGHAGTVAVPLLASPAQGGTTTTFQVTWASAAPAAGLEYRIQVKPPGATAFSAWKTTTTATGAGYLPRSGAGTYAFRARLDRVADGRAVGWSAPVSIRVR
jgi:acetyl esterase